MNTSTDINRNQGFLEHTLSKVDFSIGVDIYMLPSSLNIRWYDKRI